MTIDKYRVVIDCLTSKWLADETAEDLQVHFAQARCLDDGGSFKVEVISHVSREDALDVLKKVRGCKYISHYLKDNAHLEPLQR